MSRSGNRRQRGPALFVRNISDRVRYDEIKHLFERYGHVVDVTIPLDYYTRVPKGFCFVEYADSRDAEEAINRMNRSKFYGRELEIEFARGDRKTPADMRTRDRDRRFDSHSDRRRSRSPLDRKSPSYDRFKRRRSRSPMRKPSLGRYSRSGSMSERDSRRSISFRRSRSNSRTDSFRRGIRNMSIDRNGGDMR